MASTWGESWGGAWSDSWGIRTPLGGRSGRRRRPQRNEPTPGNYTGKRNWESSLRNEDLANIDGLIKRIEDEARDKTRQKVLTDSEKTRRREALAKAGLDAKAEGKPVELFVPSKLDGIADTLTASAIAKAAAQSEEEELMLLLMTA